MSQIFNKAILVQTKLSNNFLTANNFLKAAKNFVNTSEQDNDRTSSTALPLVKSDQKTKYLNSKLIDFNPGWNNLNVLSLCPKAQDSLYVNTKSGVYTCLSCDKTGDWNEFKHLVEKIIDEEKSCSEDEQEPEIIKKKIKFRQAWNQAKQIRELNDSQFKILARNSGLSDELSKSIFEAYDIRIHEQDIMAPVMDHKSQLLDIILLNSKDRNESLKPNHIFGLDTLSTKTNSVLYITDDVFNLMALKQELKKPVIVLNSIEALSDQVLALLEKFDSIIIWQKDTKLSYNLAKKLNQNRCNLINYARTPYESLIMKENLVKIVSSEKFPLKNESIVEYKDFKESVYAEVVHSKQYSGTQWKRFPILNDILKGHRPGELTIFTGPTGSGKTTFLSEYSLDLCVQGVKTMWGSFEIQNHRLAKMMMTQYSRLNLYKNVELFDYVSSQYSKLPLKFMSFHGQETVQNVLKTMSNAVVLHDIKHIVIDNLQFMIGNQFSGSLDRFAQQDYIIGSFRRFATNFNCHVTIVIHPKKEDSDELLKISSIFGSAKAAQEADNILILQEHKTAKEKKKHVD